MSGLAGGESALSGSPSASLLVKRGQHGTFWNLIRMPTFYHADLGLSYSPSELGGLCLARVSKDPTIHLHEHS
jgi:hypothetical protein